MPITAADLLAYYYGTPPQMPGYADGGRPNPFALTPTQDRFPDYTTYDAFGTPYEVQRYQPPTVMGIDPLLLATGRLGSIGGVLSRAAAAGATGTGYGAAIWDMVMRKAREEMQSQEPPIVDMMRQRFGSESYPRDGRQSDNVEDRSNETRWQDWRRGAYYDMLRHGRMPRRIRPELPFYGDEVRPLASDPIVAPPHDPQADLLTVLPGTPY